MLIQEQPIKTILIFASVIKNIVIMKKLSIPELQIAFRKVANQVYDLHDAGKPVPHSLYNRWIRLYKELEIRLDAKVAAISIIDDINNGNLKKFNP